MADWLIVIPAWGERALDYLQTTSLPSVQAALDYAGVTTARFIIHTDNERLVRKLVPGALTLPAPTCVSKYHGLGYCHQQAISRAEVGERVVILNADIAVSIELFAACEKRFAAGKCLILAAATRTLSDDRPPIGARSRDLLSWVWANKHPTITEAIWDNGHSQSLSSVHFVNGDEVVTHAFHLHPIAFVRRPGLRFGGITVDYGLIDAFTRDEVHVVVDADELALAECSPTDLSHGLQSDVFNYAAVVRWATKIKSQNQPRASAAHKWLFGHRIVIRGSGKELGDSAVADTVLGML